MNLQNNRKGKKKASKHELSVTVFIWGTRKRFYVSHQQSSFSGYVPSYIFCPGCPCLSVHLSVLLSICNKFFLHNNSSIPKKIKLKHLSFKDNEQTMWYSHLSSRSRSHLGFKGHMEVFYVCTSSLQAQNLFFEVT